MKRADLLMRFPDYQRFCMSTPSLTDDTAQPDRHYALLKDAIAPWLGQASSTRRRALAEATLQAHATNAELKRLTGVHWNAQMRWMTPSIRCKAHGHLPVRGWKVHC